MLYLNVTILSSGIIYGYNVVALIKELLQTSDDRAEYKWAVKLLKHQQNNTRAEKMAKSMMSQNQRDLWSEVKLMDSYRTTVPKMIDVKQSDLDISQEFMNMYQDLYNSVSYNRGEMTILLHTIAGGVQSECHTGLC